MGKLGYDVEVPAEAIVPPDPDDSKPFRFWEAQGRKPGGAARSPQKLFRRCRLMRGERHL